MRIALRFALVTVALFACFALGSGIAMSGIAAPQQGSAGAAALSLLIVCVLEALGIVWLIARSRWSGWQLIVAVFIVFYGVTTFMPQIESAVFLTHLPAGMLPRLFLMGLIIGVPFSILAVAILGKRKRAVPDSASSPVPMPASEWVWKLAIIAVVYVVLYFTFGYFIAWQNPAVREYYGGADPGSFFRQMQTVGRDTPWLIPFQIFRALCWAGIAAVIARMLQRGRVETAFAVAYIFSVVMNAQLLLPNPYMPEAVRMAHFLETASSNFLFGLLVGWLLSVRDARGPVHQSVTTVFY